MPKTAYVLKAFYILLLGYDEIREIILHEKFLLFGAFQTTASTPNYMNCRIVSIPGAYGSRPTGIGYQKDSPFGKVFDYNIERMRASGVLDRIMAKYSLSPQACPDLRYCTWDLYTQFRAK